jgi:hypothetical protein
MDVSKVLALKIFLFYFYVLRSTISVVENYNQNNSYETNIILAKTFILFTGSYFLLVTTSPNCRPYRWGCLKWGSVEKTGKVDSLGSERNRTPCAVKDAQCYDKAVGGRVPGTGELGGFGTRPRTTKV